jgi:hypothetical protein
MVALRCPSPYQSKASSALPSYAGCFADASIHIEQVDHDIADWGRVFHFPFHDECLLIDQLWTEGDGAGSIHSAVDFAK